MASGRSFCSSLPTGNQKIGYAHIGYLPSGLSQSLAKVIDKGIGLQADVKVIGGYGYKETLGALINITV